MNLAQRYHREWVPTNLNGCVLYLPFWRYGSNVNKIYDQSGNNNHGTITGAVPASYPMLSPVDSVTNGTFTGNATGWTLGDGWAYATDNVAKNADGTGTCSQTVPIVVGKRYRLGFWISSWTVGTVTPSIGGVTGTARGANGYYEEIFVASSTADLAFTPTNTSRFTLDTVSIQEVVGYEGLGWGFDGVDDLVTVMDHESLRFTTAMTALMWIRVSHTANRLDGFLGKTQTIWSNISYSLRTNGSNQCQFVTSGDGTAIDQLPVFVLPNSGWNCVAFRFGTGVKDIFVNGVQGTPRAWAGPIYTNTQNLVLGRYAGDSPFMNGQYGELVLYNRALSAQEIRNYYELTRGRYSV